jgi:hypothetical protein
MLKPMSVKVRAWLIPVPGDESRKADVPPQLLEAWAAAVREWDWQGPATRERNVSLIQRHYHFDREAPAGLPPRLAVVWCRAGRPEPSAWIEATLNSLLSKEQHRSVA